MSETFFAVNPGQTKLMTRARGHLRIVAILQEKKGGDLLLLDLRKASPISDFFVICTAHSPLHAQALADEVCSR